MVAARRFFAAGKYYNTSKSKFWTLLEVKAFLNVVCFVCFMRITDEAFFALEIDLAFPEIEILLILF